MAPLPVTVLLLPAGTRVDDASSRDGAKAAALLDPWLSGAEAARTLLVAHGDVCARPTHPLYAQVQAVPAASRASLRPACACCVPQHGLARTLADATWRFARAGERQYDRVLLVTDATEPLAVLRTLTETDALRERYVLARCIVRMADEPPGTCVEQALLRRLELADVLWVQEAVRPAWQDWAARAGLPARVVGAGYEPEFAPLASPAAMDVLRDRSHSLS